MCIGASPFSSDFFKRFKKEEEEGKLQKCKIVEECAHCKNARRCTLQNSEEVHIAKMRKCKIVQECAHCKNARRCTLPASRGFTQKGAAATLSDFKEVEEV